MKMTISRLATVLLLASASTSAVYADAEISPGELIKKMSSALTTLNYEGNFVHIHDGQIEAMEIVHSSDHNGELEYMLSLNGEAREIYRNRSLVTCIWPNSNSVIVSDSKQRQILPQVDESLANSAIYELSMAEDDRVAGLEASVINIKPRDNFRYGYRFWVDKNTNMLLRSMLLDEKDIAVEQVMFTNISYPEYIPAVRFQTPKRALDAKLIEQPKPTKQIIKDTEDRVTFASLPAGYSEVSESYKPMPINDGPVSHVMLSDGMASISVYVEYVKESDRQDIPLGMSTMGAMNAFTHSTPDALITVVGEVPSATVEAVALAVRLAE